MRPNSTPAMQQKPSSTLSRSRVSISSSPRDSLRHPRFIQILNSLSNMLTFAFGLVFSTTGITYLSTYSYSYSLNSFSVDMMAGMLLTAGLIISILCTVRVFFKAPRIQYRLVLGLAITLVIFGLLFFILGICGLSIDHSSAALANFRNTIQKYNQNDKRSSYTRKVDWIQARFNCCGIAGYQDWKSMFSYRNTNLPVNHYDQKSYYGQGLPYIDGI